MKVKDLITKLHDFRGDMEVAILVGEDEFAAPVASIDLQINEEDGTEFVQLWADYHENKSE